MSATSAALAVVNDMHSVEGNVAQLGAAISNYQAGKDPGGAALAIAIQNTGVSTVAALTDIAQTLADTPAGSVLSKTLGIAGLITSWQSLINDVSQANADIAKGGSIKLPTLLSVIGDVLQVIPPTVQVTAEAAAALSLAPEVGGGCCQSNANSSPLGRSSPKPELALPNDLPPLSQGG